MDGYLDPMPICPPNELTLAEPVVLERGVRLSRSLLWKLQRASEALRWVDEAIAADLGLTEARALRTEIRAILRDEAVGT